MQGKSPPVLVKESHIQTYSRTSVCGRTYLGVVYRKDRIYYTRIRYEIFCVHTYVTYENVIWRTYVTHKNMISKCVCTFFLHMKMCNVLFSFTFFRIWTDAYQNVPKAERVRFTCF